MDFTAISSSANSRLRCARPDSQSFSQRVAADVQLLSSSLSPDEQVQATVVPAILSHIAWHFALQAVELGSARRIPSLKRLSRSVKLLHRAYEQTLDLDLSPSNRHILQRETDRFIDECRHDFTILYYAVNAQLKKNHPDDPDDDMRTLAVISMLIIGIEERHNRRMDSILSSRLGSPAGPTVMMLPVQKLNAAMFAYAAIPDLSEFCEQQTALAVKVIENRISQIEFNII